MVDMEEVSPTSVSAPVQPVSGGYSVLVLVLALVLGVVAGFALHLLFFSVKPAVCP
ncbi:MAG: hypothetical protein HY917_00920, partial [Candidatus Diapherotrites archaeon]|nr:hypothetical protein [Candidatus Diapherotrites archaeon]